MIIRSAGLETVCGITSVLPKNEAPEFAFAGRSNVGKSSLINGLLNRRSLARTSSQPGKTQTINYYRINEEFYFVDLPGYGYARVSQETREKWGRMIEKYLATSRQLKAVFLLVDCRHEPSAGDKQMAEWVLYHGLRPIVIATKSDKLSKNQLNRQMSVIKKALSLPAGVPVIPFSSLTRQGRNEIWAAVESALRPEESPAPAPSEEEKS